MMALDTEIMFF